MPTRSSAPKVAPSGRVASKSGLPWVRIAVVLLLTLLGGKGTISVTANVAPRLMHEMIAAAFAGDVAKAREINFRLLGLHKNLFVEANPIPVKWACQQMGLIGGGLRLPMTPLSPECHDRVRAAMREAGIQLR